MIMMRDLFNLRGSLKGVLELENKKHKIPVQKNEQGYYYAERF